MAKPRKCPLCNGDKFTDFLKIGKNFNDRKEFFLLVKCSNCGLVSLGSFPKNSGDYYSGGYSPHRDFSIGKNELYRSRNAALEKLKRVALTDFIEEPEPWGEKRHLDVGCGSGKFLHKMSAKGWRAFGLEISQAACNVGRKKGLDIQQGSIKECRFNDGVFDLITMSHVLEHLDDPVGDMMVVFKKLKSEGKLILAVPNIDSWEAKITGKKWIGYDVPLHLFHFSPKTLKKLLKSIGFVDISIKYNPSTALLNGSMDLPKNIPLHMRRYLLLPFGLFFSSIRRSGIIIAECKKP